MEFSLAAVTTPNAGSIVCDVVANKTDFNGAAYMGVWFEQQHVKNQGFQLDNWTCGQAVYTEL